MVIEIKVDRVFVQDTTRYLPVSLSFLFWRLYRIEQCISSGSDLYPLTPSNASIYSVRTEEEAKEICRRYHEKCLQEFPDSEVKLII